MNSILVEAKEARFLGVDISAVPPFLTFEELEQRFESLFNSELKALESREQQCIGTCFQCKEERPIVQCMPCQHMVCFECVIMQRFMCCNPILFLEEPTQVVELYDSPKPRISQSKTVPDFMRLEIHEQVSPKTLLKLLRENDFTVECTGYTFIEAQPHDFVIYDFVLNIANYNLRFFKRYSDFRRLAHEDRYLEAVPEGKWWYFGGNETEYIVERKIRLQSWLFRQLKGSNNQSVELARFICGK